MKALGLTDFKGSENLSGKKQCAVPLWNYELVKVCLLKHSFPWTILNSFKVSWARQNVNKVGTVWGKSRSLSSTESASDKGVIKFGYICFGKVSFILLNMFSMAYIIGGMIRRDAHLGEYQHGNLFDKQDIT